MSEPTRPRHRPPWAAAPGREQVRRVSRSDLGRPPGAGSGRPGADRSRPHCQGQLASAWGCFLSPGAAAPNANGTVFHQRLRFLP